MKRIVEGTLNVAFVDIVIVIRRAYLVRASKKSKPHKLTHEPIFLEKIVFLSCVSEPRILSIVQAGTTAVVLLCCVLL